MPSDTDRIQKTILLKAPPARVWRALTDTGEFETWFGMRFEAPFVPGARIHGTVVPTKVDAEVAKHQQPHAGLRFEIKVERMDRERLFSFRWHPGAVEPGVDYSAEPTTLVAFELQAVPEGVQLTVTESGFDQIPLARRASAFAQNKEGWGMVVTLIQKYLASAA